MSKHTGGVKGFQYQLAICPRCRRVISGGRVVNRRGYWLNLRSHKVPGTGPDRPWCLKPGDRCEAEAIW